MAQKYYAAEKGSLHLSITNHQGELTERDIVNNLAKMIQADEESEENAPTWNEAQSRAREFYEENVERILEMVKIGTPLQEVSEETADEAMSLTLSEWLEWEFPRTELD